MLHVSPQSVFFRGLQVPEGADEEVHLQYVHLVIWPHSSLNSTGGAWRVLHDKDVSGCRMLNVGPRRVALS